MKKAVAVLYGIATASLMVTTVCASELSGETRSCRLLWTAK